MTPPSSPRRTPLTDRHEAAGARLVDFAGFLMPVQYGPILEEVRRVRAHAGIFDLCHMGRCRILGPRREEAAQYLVHVNVARMKPGAIRYSFFLREDGTTLDDVLLYRDEDEMFFCINAGNRERDLEWMRTVAEERGCTVEDQSEQLAMIAIQGPASEAVLAPLCDLDLPALGYYRFVRGRVCGRPAMISRTGYTGEDGFEIVPDAADAGALWDALLDAGQARGVQPIGLGARDTLRLEAGMALYGHELDDTTNPVEAGLVARIPHQHDFSGRAAVEAMLATGPARRLAGFTTDGPRVPRPGYELFEPSGGEALGRVVSGAVSPTLDTHLGTAYVRTGRHVAGTNLEMEVRSKRYPVQVVTLPFYERSRTAAPPSGAKRA